MSELKKYRVDVRVEFDCSKTFEAIDEGAAIEQAELLHPAIWVDSHNSDYLYIARVREIAPEEDGKSE